MMVALIGAWIMCYHIVLFFDIFSNLCLKMFVCWNKNLTKKQLKVPVSGRHWAAPPWWWVRRCVLCTEWSLEESLRCLRWRPLTSASSPIPRCRCAAAAGWDRPGHTHKNRDRRHTRHQRYSCPLFIHEQKASKQQDSLFRRFCWGGEGGTTKFLFTGAEQACCCWK